MYSHYENSEWERKKYKGKTIIPLNVGKRNRIDRDRNGTEFCAMHEKKKFFGA